MEIKMGISRADVEVMVDKIIADKGEIKVADFTDENLGQQVIRLVTGLNSVGFSRGYIVNKAEECFGCYFKKVGMDFAKIFKKPDVLDETEKEYLKTFLAPWLKLGNRERIMVKKVELCREYYLAIDLSGMVEDTVALPNFSKTLNMYKGMVANRNYTVEELGLR